MRRQFEERTSCLDVPTLGSLRAMLNCTEGSGRHRNGWAGYTKVYEPGFCRGGTLYARSGARMAETRSTATTSLQMAPAQAAEGHRVGKQAALHRTDGF
jgi:hypothetical protein